MIAGYVSTPDTDHYGDDIGQASSVDDAAARCNQDSACLSFNSGNYYKRGVFPTRWLGNACFYIKLGKTGESRWCEAARGGRGGTEVTGVQTLHIYIGQRVM